MGHPRFTGLRRAVVLVFATLWLIALVGGPANAAPKGALLCNAAGSVLVVEGPPFGVSWTVAVKGACFDTSGDKFAVDLSGTGTSDSLGACDETGFVQNLHIKVSGTLTSASDLSVTTLAEDWEGPITTFPVAVPFLVEVEKPIPGGAENADLVGVGTIFTRIFGKCPPKGTPNATIIWTHSFTPIPQP